MLHLHRADIQAILVIPCEIETRPQGGLRIDHFRAAEIENDKLPYVYGKVVFLRADDI